MAYDFARIEKKWQEYWLKNKSFAALPPERAGGMPKAYVLDMFPYPSGAGLHVGHPEGYTATDIVARFLRMTGHNVLHPMGWDAFGLPAEQYAVANNIHPRQATERNIANFRRQIQLLGLSYDWDREIDTTDPKYYRWTQWIFLKLFNSYFNPVLNKAMPIAHLESELASGNLLVAPDGRLVVSPDLGSIPEALTFGAMRIARRFSELSDTEQRDAIDGHRLAYMDDAMVNWCPALGTVLANEEVIDGKSERGNHPVERRPMRQWMLRITAYADRLLADLDALDWPESLKEMQRQWIGRSVGAEIDFEIDPAGLSSSPWLDAPGGAADAAEAVAESGLFAREDEPADPCDAPQQKDLPSDDAPIVTVFTTRPDTLYGATYLVLAPEHPLVRRITTQAQRPAVAQYIAATAARSERDRMADAKSKTGVMTGAFAKHPMSDRKIPVWIADYVLPGYGTGAIMAVPAHDQRDWDFAQAMKLPIVPVVLPPDAWLSETWHQRGNPPMKDPAALRNEYRQHPESFGLAYVDEGTSINSPAIDGLETPQAAEQMIHILVGEDLGVRSVKYKLRDWLFSRQRYWGEPFPIILDATGRAFALDESKLPLVLPDMTDFKPTGTPEAPLSKVRDWVNVTVDGKPFVRETNTMPQWAGSCWYYLRYLDPHNATRFVDPAIEKYWMPVDLYVGGVEHAVLHLLYARFWHKVLFDLNYVSTPEPFARLVNQGLILGEMEYHVFESADGKPVSLEDCRDVAETAGEDGPQMTAVDRRSGQSLLGRRLTEDQVEKSSEGFRLKSNTSIRVDGRSFKMSKSRGNVVNPDEIVRDFGADTFRLYEMYMGPLEVPKPWNTRDIVGMSRFLASVWRNLVGETPETPGAPVATTASDTQISPRLADEPIEPDLDRALHFTIQKVAADIKAMRFNTAIAALITLNNQITGLKKIPRSLADRFVLILSPFAPHIAEEIWQRLGHATSLSGHPWPTVDPAKLVVDRIELPVQVNGKIRGKITMPIDADEPTVLAAAEAVESVKPWLTDKTIVRRVYVSKRLVSFVVK